MKYGKQEIIINIINNNNQIKHTIKTHYKNTL